MIQSLQHKIAMIFLLLFVNSCFGSYAKDLDERDQDIYNRVGFDIGKTPENVGNVYERREKEERERMKKEQEYQKQQMQNFENLQQIDPQSQEEDPYYQPIYPRN